ncbi:hypothetical protein PIB30_023452 [Stylosanthes scabra]|uniref:Uncharacterized protein n=1 Tax=Stylosanthes scabra TaxID=79078 RepID=A0ABU6Q9P7_9FABA|nr:hypothetical protein [Stylosanthes scabra]
MSNLKAACMQKMWSRQNPQKWRHSIRHNFSSVFSPLNTSLCARFSTLSRRFGSSPPSPPPSSRRHESNEPSHATRSLLTRRHAPPEGPLPASSFSSPEATDTVGSAFAVHGPDSAMCCHFRDPGHSLQKPPQPLDLCTPSTVQILPCVAASRIP